MSRQRLLLKVSSDSDGDVSDDEDDIVLLEVGGSGDDDESDIENGEM